MWAAKSDRVEVLELLVELGARVDADPYRGTALTWAAVNGRVDVGPRSSSSSAPTSNRRATFGGPDHGEGVTALHLAAQAGRREAVETLLELGADPTIADALHDGTPAGWAGFGGHAELAELLATLARPASPAKARPSATARRRARAPRQPRTRTRCRASGRCARSCRRTRW